MKSECFVCLVIASAANLTFADDNPRRLIPSTRVLFENVVRKASGSTTTFRFIEPPAAPPVQSVAANTQANASVVPVNQTTISAHVFEGSLSEVSWNFKGYRCVAWSNVDFSLLQGITDFEMGGVHHRVMALAVRRTTRQQFEQRRARQRTTVPLQGSQQPVWPAFPAATLAAAPPGITAWFALVDFDGPQEMEEQACASLEALHAYVESNRPALEARQAAAKQAASTTLPQVAPSPEHTIIQVWPLNEDQIRKRAKELEGQAKTSGAKEEKP